MTRYQLTCTQGAEVGQEFQIEPGTTFLGRLDPVSAGDPPGSRRIVVQDLSVSRTHCRIDWIQSEQPKLTHLSGTNETWVNGASVLEHQLSAEEYVQIGMTIFYLGAKVAEPVESADPGDLLPEEHEGGWECAEDSPWIPDQQTLSDGWTPQVGAPDPEGVWEPK